MKKDIKKRLRISNFLWYTNAPRRKISKKRLAKPIGRSVNMSIIISAIAPKKKIQGFFVQTNPQTSTTIVKGNTVILLSQSTAKINVKKTKIIVE